jgi:hypothetical protein
MTTINITQDPDNGALQLAITTLETITAITRTDANGVGDVRTLPGLLPWTAPRVEIKRNKATNGWPGTSDGWGTSSGYVKTYEAAGRFGRTKTMLYTKTGTGVYVTYGRRAGAWGAGSSTTVPTNTDEVATAVPGETIKVRLDIGTDTANTTGSLAIRFFDASFADLGSNNSAAVDMLVNTHQTMTHQATAPASTAYYWLEWNVALKSGSTVGGEKAWASRCVLGDTGVMFDGGSSDNATIEYRWAGTAFKSDSIAESAGADLIVSDFEAASGTVSYTAGEDTEVTTWDIGNPWLFVPVMPAYSVRIQALLDYSAGGQSLGTIHELLGREDPVAVLRGMSTRRGSIKLYCGTFAEATTVVEATRRGEVLMLRQPEHQGMDMYFTATSYGIPTLETRGAESVFGVEIGYVQLARPIGDLSGSLGWTFDALAAAYPTFATVAKKYATFQDLLLNETI